MVREQRAGLDQESDEIGRDLVACVCVRAWNVAKVDRQAAFRLSRLAGRTVRFECSSG